MTREQILAQWPRASESFIKANLGNSGNPIGMNVTTIANAFEHNQRVVGGGNRGGKTKVVMDILESYPGTVAFMTKTASTPIPQSSTSKGWVELGGKRFYAKSLWEQNYALYLEYLKSTGFIKDWEYEPETFWFEGIRRGTNNYKPDFKVWLNDSTTEFREVKGFMCPKSKTKIRRMKKYHPDVKLRVFGKKWWKKHNAALAAIVPGWKRKEKKKKV